MPSPAKRLTQSARSQTTPRRFPAEAWARATEYLEENGIPQSDIKKIQELFEDVWPNGNAKLSEKKSFFVPSSIRGKPLATIQLSSRWILHSIEDTSRSQYPELEVTGNNGWVFILAWEAENTVSIESLKDSLLNDTPSNRPSLVHYTKIGKKAFLSRQTHYTRGNEWDPAEGDSASKEFGPNGELLREQFFIDGVCRRRDPSLPSAVEKWPDGRLYKVEYHNGLGELHRPPEIGPAIEYYDTKGIVLKEASLYYWHGDEVDTPSTMVIPTGRSPRTLISELHARRRKETDNLWATFQKPLNKSISPLSPKTAAQTAKTHPPSSKTR